MEDLQELDQLLRDHFGQLRARRDLLDVATPLFALEHCLGPDLLDILKARVREEIRSGPPSSRWPLPYVVYAAEIGYRYEDEFWPSFETSTPGWIQHGNRPWVRTLFSRFSEDYGGARPSGAWGKQFSIISWPITHAVLPTDLQRHLARLLSDYRHRLSPELITHPDELGSRLAGRAATTSARFRVFAQNTSLLGQVAASLLLHEDSDSPLLERRTLDRIVADLSAEEESRRWLKSARETALRLELRGLGGIGNSGLSRAQSNGQDSERSSRVEAPKLSLRPSAAGWTIEFEPPDLSPLFERFPDLQEVLASARPQIAGASPRAPRPRGKLLFSGLTVPLASWPPENVPPVQLEGVDEKFNTILAEECLSPFSDPCLFRLSDTSIANQIKGRQIRAGRRYALVTQESPGALLTWATSFAIDCANVFAYKLDVPDRLTPSDVEFAAQLGLRVISELALRPIGIEPADWDGEGSAEWIIGDDPIVEIDSTIQAVRCILMIDELEPSQFPWPPADGHSMYVRMVDLSLGDHELQVALVPSGENPQTISGTLRFSIREPRNRTSSGSFREALLLLPSPAAPTLEDLWEGRAALEILGPPECQVDIVASLEGHQGQTLVAKRLDARRLPIDNAIWQSTFDGSFRRTLEVRRNYDLASSCVIHAGDPEVGFATLRFDRSFVPLRWGMGLDRDEQFLRLHDNTDGEQTTVEHYSFDRPDESRPMTPSTDGTYTDESGGLFVARSPEILATTILPPRIRSLSDLQRLGREMPRITHRPRTPESLAYWASHAATWTEAETRGDPVVEKTRDDVVRAFTISIAAVVGGHAWSAAEYAVAHNGTRSLPSLELVAGSDRDPASVLRQLAAMSSGLPTLTLPERVGRFSIFLESISIRGVANPAQGIHVQLAGQRQLVVSGTSGARISNGSMLASTGLLDRTWFAEFTLRLASAPSTVERWSADAFSKALAAILESPIALRAARYLVLHLHHAGIDIEPSTPYGGWLWD